MFSITNVTAMHILAHMFSIEDAFLEVKFPGHRGMASSTRLDVSKLLSKVLVSLILLSTMWECGFLHASPPPKKNTTQFQLFFPMAKSTHYLKEKIRAEIQKSTKKKIKITQNSPLRHS